MLGREVETPASTDAWDACPASLLEGADRGLVAGRYRCRFHIASQWHKYCFHRPVP